MTYDRTAPYAAFILRFRMSRHAAFRAPSNFGATPTSRQIHDYGSYLALRNLLRIKRRASRGDKDYPLTSLGFSVGCTLLYGSRSRRNVPFTRGLLNHLVIPD